MPGSDDSACRCRPPTDYVQAGVGTRVAFSTRPRHDVRGRRRRAASTPRSALRLDHPALGATYTQRHASATRRNRFQPAVGQDAGARRCGSSARCASGDLRAHRRVRPRRRAGAGRRAARSSTARAPASIGLPARLSRRAPSPATSSTCSTSSTARSCVTIEHGLATLPVYLRRLHFGAARGRRHRVRHDVRCRPRPARRRSARALRLDAFFGYFVPGTFEVGYARGLTEGGISETWFLLTGSL